MSPPSTVSGNESAIPVRIDGVIPPPLMEVRGITKEFPGCKALKGVSLELQAGEVVAILGENGAGKSTLMKILAGVQPPDSGEIKVDGQVVSFDDVRDAMQAGISLIHQELNLADNLDIGANIFLGREPRRFGMIDRATIREKSRGLLERVGLPHDPDTLVSRLTTGQQQLVEIAKALSMQARVLIMDEPTSSLSERETLLLFEVVRELRKQGVCIVYISHRLGEIVALADRVVVLRDGENAGQIPKQQITHDRMVRMMVGRDLGGMIRRQATTLPGEECLRVEKLVTPVFPNHEISFALRHGEVVGMAGLVGAGRTELLETLFGVRQAESGSITINGKTQTISSPREAMKAGLALVPEDRKLHGVIVDMDVRQNISLPSLKNDSRAGIFLNDGAEGRDAVDMIARLRIKTPTDRQIVKFLSGGNQQKVVLGKWLVRSPKILLLDEPTRGIDVGAKQEIYQLMERLAGEGMAVLFVSSDLEEVLRMSDRVLVMHEGRLAGELPRSELSEQAIMGLATGGSSTEPLPEQMIGRQESVRT